MLTKLKANALAVLRGEPVLTGLAINLVVSVGLLVGFDLDPTQVAAVFAGLSTLTSIVARSKSTPAANPAIPAEVKPVTKLNDL